LAGKVPLAIGSDHAGFELKQRVLGWLRRAGWDVVDFGVDSPESADYPDIAEKVANSVRDGQSEKGILVCGTGLGMSIAANKVRGVRAALCHDPFSARQSRLHNDANVLALGSWVMGEELAKNIVEVWLKTGFEGGRHERRVRKISLIEARQVEGGTAAGAPERRVKAGEQNAGVQAPDKPPGNVDRLSEAGGSEERPHQNGGTSAEGRRLEVQEGDDVRLKWEPEGALSVDLERIKADLASACEELFSVADLEPGQILVVGCSTSEIRGEKIGKGSSAEIADAVLDVLLNVTSKNALYLAVQGCEHINRSLVVTREAMRRYGLEEVSVYPVLHAGGALAATAMERFRDPVTVEGVRAHAGIDIGDTLIGMHLRAVAVPVRSRVKKIGHANLVMARTRPRLVGGARAQYRGVREK
jgi:ribose 5-phosphate isomerase B/conserved hypothetical protein TIGR01440